MKERLLGMVPIIESLGTESVFLFLVQYIFSTDATFKVVEGIEL